MIRDKKKISLDFLNGLLSGTSVCNARIYVSQYSKLMTSGDDGVTEL